MYRKIVVGFENTEQGRDALELGRALARASGATMVVASVAGDGEPGREPEVSAERLAAYVSAHLHELDVAIVGRVARASSPAAGLRSLVEEEDADLAVVGSTHRSPLGRILPGATGERLMRTADCAVAIAPRGYGSSHRMVPAWRPLSEPADDSGIRRIGVGYDASDAARQTLRVGVELAIRNQVELRVIAVGAGPGHGNGRAGDLRPLLHGSSNGHRDLRDALDRAVGELPAEAGAEAVFARGYPAAELTREAERGLDLLLLGSNGGNPVRQALVGGIASRVLHGAGCPVLVCSKPEGKVSSASAAARTIALA